VRVILGREDAMSTGVGIIVLIGRILFSAEFGPVAGIGFHIRQSTMAEGYARSMNFPVPAIAGWPTGIWLTAASLSIALGIWPDVGALMVAAFVTPAAWWFHRFWEVGDPMQKQTAQILFFRNLAFLGASLALFGLFVAIGDGLRFAVTGPLFSF
jgi:putative oxidoreductase